MTGRKCYLPPPFKNPSYAPAGKQISLWHWNTLSHTIGPTSVTCGSHIISLGNRYHCDTGTHCHRQWAPEEFEIFTKHNGIKHVTSAPYHPASNRDLFNSSRRDWKHLCMMVVHSVQHVSNTLSVITLPHMRPLWFLHASSFYRETCKLIWVYYNQIVRGLW